MAVKVAARVGQVKSASHGTIMSEELWDKNGNQRDPEKPWHPCS
jgi:recombinational DNA repair protein RecT